MSPNDDFASISQSLVSDGIAIVIPWHGAITLGSTLREAVSRHVVFGYTARMDVTLPTSAPTMPVEQCSSLRELVEQAGYFDETWALIRRKAKVAYNVDRVIPLMS